jgi:uncharacterized protein YuzE
MKLRIPFTILAFGVTSFALAQGLPAFEEVDANGDGLIDADEAGAVEGLDITTADANQDGVLDRDEYEAASQQ